VSLLDGVTSRGKCEVYASIADGMRRSMFVFGQAWWRSAEREVKCAQPRSQNVGRRLVAPVLFFLLLVTVAPSVGIQDAALHYLLEILSPPQPCGLAFPRVVSEPGEGDAQPSQGFAQLVLLAAHGCRADQDADVGGEEAFQVRKAVPDVDCPQFRFGCAS